MNTNLISKISVGRRSNEAVIQRNAVPLCSRARMGRREAAVVFAAFLRLLCLLAAILLGPVQLRAADPIDAVLTGGIHPTAKRVEKDYVFTPSAAKQQTYVYVYNTETNYFPTQRLDTVTWAIEGPTLGLKITGLGTNDAGTAASAVVEPAGPFDAIQSGALKFTATDINAVTKTLTLTVADTAGTPDGCFDGKCGAIATAGLQLKTGVTAFPVRVTGPVNPGDVNPLDPIVSPTSPPNVGYCNVTATPDENIPQLTFFGGGNSGEFEGGEFGDALVRDGSIDLRILLGRCEFGKTAGSLSMKETYPTNLLSTPTCLNFCWKTNYDCEVLTNGAGIRQIKVPEGLADVSTNTTYKYYVNIFPTNGVGSKVGGYYQTSGVPLLTLTVENPDTSNTNKLRITDGDGYVYNYEWKTSGWELSSGNGLRQEFNSITNSGSTRLITSEVRHNTNALVAWVANKYDNTWPFGEKIIEQNLGEGATALTNTFTYYTNGYATGLVQQATLAYGNWEYHQYETNRLLTNTCIAWLNQAPTTDGSLCRRFEYAYGTNAVPGAGDTGEIQAATPRRTIDYLLNHEISRRYTIFLPGERRDIRCVTPGAAWTNGDNLVTTTKYYTIGTNIGRVASVERPDGTTSIFQYEFGTNAGGLSIRTDIVSSGLPNAGKTAIADGISNRTVHGPFGQFFSFTNYDIGSGIVRGSQTVTNHDAFNRPRMITYLDGKSEGFEHGCCGPITATNREGTVTTYARDPLARTTSQKTAGITRSNYLDAAGRVLQNLRIPTNGVSGMVTLQTNAWDTAGRLSHWRNAAQYLHTNAEAVADNRLTRTNFFPDGSTRIKSYYRDGRPCKLTGTAVHPVRFTNGVEKIDGLWREYSQEIKLDASGNDTAQWNKTYVDHVGRVFRSVHSGQATNQSFYNTKGQLEKQVDADGVTKLFAYNQKGELELSAVDMDRDSIIDTNGTDRITGTTTIVVNNGNKDVARTLSYIWATNNSSVSNLVSVAERAADGTRAWNTNYGVASGSETTLPGSGQRYQINRDPDGSAVVNYFKDGQLLTVTRTNAAGTQLSKTAYTYDAHGRQQTATDARNGTTTYAYNDADQMTSTTTPAPGTGQGPQTINYAYDELGRRKRTTLPDGGVVTNIFHSTGELATNCGARAYPVAYTYDHAGRRKTMKTWKNFANNSGTATTTWNYNDLGQMTNKVYDDGNGPLYFYSAGGRLERRKWARGVWTTNEYDNAGTLTNTLYSDGTSNVLYHLDRQGRRTNIVDGAGTRYFTYTDSGLLLMETNASGTLSGFSLTNGYDPLLRRTSLTLRSNTSALFTHSYTYDSRSSRLTNVSDGTYHATYDYLDNSPLFNQITFRSNSLVKMTTTKQFDYLNRLLSIISQPSASGEAAISFAYGYNDANQRIRRTDPDGSYWLYEYDRLGQLTSGKHYWADNTPVAGQQFEYAYDDIGNRTATKEGGDSSGAGLRTVSYTANALNQYDSRTVPGAADILGIAHANATVQVNALSTYRKGEYFWKEMSIHNTNSAMWTNASVVASLTGTNQTNSGYIFLPKTAESFTYDLDGNLTSDGRWTNLWDAENRVLLAESLTGNPSASKRKVTYEYDGDGRRVRHTTSDGGSGSYIVTQDLKVASDAWACLADLNASNNAIIRSYLWGLDLTGTLTGAGGVGGLLAMNSAASSTHFYGHDGNGNVAALVSASTAIASANYENGPFGQAIRSTGASSADNPYRYSTKKTDSTLDLVLYEYRTYSLASGRWRSRDSFQEVLEPNLYSFVFNCPIMFFDTDGRGRGWVIRVPPPTPLRVQCLADPTKQWVQNPNGNIPPANGCSAPGSNPNDPTGMCTFKSACDTHDLCYSDCSISQATCDANFLQDMKARCETCYNAIVQVNPARAIFFQSQCDTLANNYYSAVNCFGSKAYNNRQNQNCHCVNTPP
jgi:RHS repeat-associated protein